MSLRIGPKDLDSGVFVVAEIGGNHTGDFDAAKRLLEAAARSGADAAKFQIFRADKLVRSDLPALPHVRKRWALQIDRFRSLEFPPEGYRELAELARRLGILFMASAFDEESADLVDGLSPAFKVASGDLTHLPLLRHLAAKGKPVILSTGMAEEGEIEAALAALAGCPVVLLHCVSRYPTPPEQANLRSIPWLKERFHLPVGYSDHTIGALMSVAAAALGARMIEKHFTLDKAQEFGDHRLSLEPAEFKAMVEQIRLVEKGLGQDGKPVGSEEKALRHAMRRGLVARREIPSGAAVCAEMVSVLRPCEGIPPSELDSVIGRRARRTIAAGEPLSWDSLGGDPR